MTAGPPPLSAFSWAASAPPGKPRATPASPTDPIAAPISPAAPAPTATAASTSAPSAALPASGSIHVRLPYDFLTSPTSAPGPRLPSVSTSRSSRPPAPQPSWEPVVEWSPPPQAGRADGSLVRSPRVRMSASKPASSAAAVAAAAAPSTTAPPEPLSLGSLPERPTPHHPQETPPHSGDCVMALPPPAVMGPGRKASVSLYLFSGSASSKPAKDKPSKGATQPQVPRSLSAQSTPAHQMASPPVAATHVSLPYSKGSSPFPSTEPATPLTLLGQVNPDLASITRFNADGRGAGPHSPPPSPPPLPSPALPSSSSGLAHPRSNIMSIQDFVPEEAVSTSDTSSYNSSDSDSLYTANGDGGDGDDAEVESRSQGADHDAITPAPRSHSISIPPHSPAGGRGLGRCSSPSLGAASLPLSERSPSGDEEEEPGGQLPTVIQLQPFYNQVGGHSSIFQFSSHAVCKPLVSRENQFYESLELNGRQLLRYVPRYLGVLNVSFRPVEPEDQASAQEQGRPASSSPDPPPSPAPQPAGISPQPGTPGLPPRRKIFKGQNMDDAEVPEVAVEMNRHLMPEWVLGAGEHEGSQPHTPAPTLWALEHPRLHPRVHGHSPPPHPWSSSSRFLGTASGTTRSYDSGAVSDSDARPCRRSRTPLSSSPQSPPATSSPRRAHCSPARSEGRHSSTPCAPARGALAAVPTATTPGGTPRPSTPGTPSNTNPPGSQTCVFGRGSTAVNRRLQAQVLREVFSASNLRDTAAAARRRTRSSRTGSSHSRSTSSTRPESTTRARSSERAPRHGELEHGGRHVTPPLHSTSRFLPNALTPASSHTSIRSQGLSTPTSPGAGSLRCSLPLSHRRPSRDIHAPATASPPRRASGEEVQATSETTVVSGHDDMFQMDDLHEPEGMPIPPVPASDLTQEHLEEPPEQDSSENVKREGTHLSWLDAGGHDKLLRSGYFLLMEDLTGRLRSPCVLDLKMGTRQYSLDATDAKRASQSSKAAATTTRSHGARICGMQVFNCQTLGYTFQDKYYGRKVRPAEFQPALARFLFNGSSLLIHHVPGIVAQLRQLARIVNQLPRYRFYASSLLFIYDGDCAAQARLMSHFERRVREGRAGVPPAWAVVGSSAACHRAGKEHHHAKPHRGEMKIRIIDFAHSTTGKDYRSPGEEFVSPLANQSVEEERHAWFAQADMYTDKEELYEAQDALEEEAWAEWLSRPIVRFAPAHPDGPDSGYLWGLQNLTATFEAIWETERQARIHAARQQALAQLDASLRKPPRHRSRASISRTLETLSSQGRAVVDSAAAKADMGSLRAPDPGVFDEIFSKFRATPDGEEGYVSDKGNLDRMAKAASASTPSLVSAKKSTPSGRTGA